LPSAVAFGTGAHPVTAATEQQRRSTQEAAHRRCACRFLSRETLGAAFPISREYDRWRVVLPAAGSITILALHLLPGATRRHARLEIGQHAQTYMLGFHRNAAILIDACLPDKQAGTPSESVGCGRANDVACSVPGYRRKDARSRSPPRRVDVCNSSCHGSTRKRLNEGNLAGRGSFAASSPDLPRVDFGAGQNHATKPLGLG